ncbi:MAG: HlyD family type I secretion periplasmic adaptor subunit [Granulosicoccus sp.]
MKHSKYTTKLDSYFHDELVGASLYSLRRHIVIGLVVALILSFSLWAAMSDVDQHVRATGRVVTAGNTRTVQHLEGGIVEQILVKEGKQVKAGDALFLIANTRVRTTLAESELQQSALMIKRIRLLAEVEGSNTVEFPDYLKRLQPDIVDAEAELFVLRRQEFLERLSGLDARQEQKQHEVMALESRIANVDKELGVLSRQAQIRRNLFDSGVVSEESYLQVKGELVRKQADAKSTEMQLPIAVAEKLEATSEIAEAGNEYVSIARAELNEVEIGLQSIQQRLAALSDEVERSKIVSPIDGRVNQLFVNTVGGVSQPGAPLAEITPARELLVVEGNISTKDRGKVWPELKTMTNISAYDHALYGGLEGRLSYISPDAFSGDDKSQYYKIRVELDSDRFDDVRIVRPGMTAEINILTGRISILDALLKPLTRLRGTALREG